MPARPPDPSPRRGGVQRPFCAALVAVVAAGLAATATPVPARAAPPRPAAAGQVVTGVGDVYGYHLYTASGGDGWTWHRLATLQPGGEEDQRWIGQQCMTGDGSTVVAVVAPWSANNTAAGMDTGAYAYAVDARTGAVRPLLSGVSLAYFDPGCGSGRQVALTGYTADDQSVTRIGTVDAVSGAVQHSTTVHRELTSAVPANGRVVAADGTALVDATTGTETVLARFPGRLRELRPAADGGVDVVATTGGTSGLWHWSTGGVRALGTGPADRTHLFQGAYGHNSAVGAAVTAGSGLRSAPAPAGGAAAASLDGTVTVGAVTAGTTSLAGPVVSTAGATRADRALPAPSGARVRTLPRASLSAGPAAAAAQSVTTASPQCAVPRNDIFKQVWQPTSAQVRWAVNQAALGALTAPYATAARPRNNSMYTLTDSSYAALPQSYPSADFPLTSGPPIPPLVMYGILAQESNWSQASWHALPGRSGNPLIANYYGSGNSSGVPIDYTSADCGYGIAQITTGMQVPGWPDTTPLPAAEQLRVAVDYATDIAAGEQILQQKWQQLAGLGITMNNADPVKVENWYGAIWAYNSGVHLPSDGTHWGLGWANNPANPIYPADRHAFLHAGLVQTPGDAAVPQDWPYQEKVFGWMEVPLTDAGGSLEYRGTFDWGATSPGSFLQTPAPATFCARTANNCDATQSGSCLNNADLTSCWWHLPAQWVPDRCAASCVTDSVAHAPNNHEYYSTPGLAEPAATPSSVLCTPGVNSGVTDGSGNLLPGTVLVDDEMIASQNPAGRTPDLMNCSGQNTKLKAPASAHASFGLYDISGFPVDAAATPDSPAAIDVHQLGGGLGGHLFFTHTGAVGGPEVTGVWRASLLTDPTYGTAYQVKVFVPDVAASSDHATYEITDSDSVQERTINQSRYGNQWVSLGYYLCTGSAQSGSACTMQVRLRTNTPHDDPNQGADIAMDALAFVPVPTGAYVALGDSYSAGEGIAGTHGSDATYQDGTDVSDSVDGNGDLCHRSSQSWPELLAVAKGRPIVNLTCSGSNTGDIAGEQYYLAQKTSPAYLLGFFNTGESEVAFQGDGKLHPTPQNGDCCAAMPNPDYAGATYYSETAYQLQLLHALRPGLVTLTAGGNDIGFADVVRSCYLRGVIIGGLCKDADFVTGGTDLLDNRIQSLEPVLEDTYRKIITAVGSSTNIYVVTYPDPVAVPTPAQEPSCSGLFTEDLQWLTPKVTQLAQVITTAAQHTGLHPVDVSTTFNGHDMCAGTPYATAPDLNILTAGGLTTSQVDNWYHPNAAGYRALETTIANQIP